jgi:hypothetical protein
MRLNREDAGPIVLILTLTIAVTIGTGIADDQMTKIFASPVLAQSNSRRQPQKQAAESKTSPAAGSAQLRGLKLAVKERTGDLDMMIENRVIRILVPYSRTLYFNDKGHERGLTAESVRDFER